MLKIEKSLLKVQIHFMSDIIKDLENQEEQEVYGEIPVDS